MTDQSIQSRLGAKLMPMFSKRVFPQEWIDAGQNRERLEVIARKRRSLDGPRPDLVLQRTWSRATTEIAGRPLHLLTPKAGSTGGVLFYCHGGAFVVGPSSFEWLHASRFAKALGLDLALYDYPKVPEHDSSSIRAATMTAYKAIAGRYRSSRTAIAGLSAGGGLAVATMLQLQQDAQPLPVAAALFSPWLDVTISHPEARTYAESDLVLPIPSLRHDGILYAGQSGAAEPFVSPRFASVDQLRALPPTVVTAGDQEILLPEAREFVDKLQQAGVAASLHVERFGQHAGVAGNTPEGNEVLDATVAQLRTFLR